MLVFVFTRDSFWVRSFYFILFYFLKYLYWSIIALQCCVSFCYITKWISYAYTYIRICPPSWASLPPALSHLSKWSWSTESISLCYAAPSHQPTILHMVVYVGRCYSHFALPAHVIKSILYVYLFIPVPLFFFFF